MLEEDSPSCAACHKPASLLCHGCNDTADGTSKKVYYCNKACQQADWQIHKSACKDAQARKRLYRAGDLLQAAFYVLREENFDRNLAGVRENDGKVDLIDAPAGNPGPTYRLPASVTDDALIEIALSYNAGSDACYGALDELFMLSVKGLTTKVAEMAIEVKKTHLRVRSYRAASPIPQGHEIHRVIHIMLKNGDEYVVDLAGAQYGQYKPIVPFASYMDDFAAKILAREPYGVNIDNCFAIVQMRHDAQSYLAAGRRLCDLSKEYVSDRLYDWEEENQTVLAILKSNEQGFLEGKAKLVAHLKKSAQDFIKKCNNDPTSEAKPFRLTSSSNAQSYLPEVERARVEKKRARIMSRMPPDVRATLEKDIAKGTHMVFM